MNEKNLVIFGLIILLAIVGVGWYISAQLDSSQGEIPYDNTYKWTEVFHGYEAYLDQQISYSEIKGTSMEPTFGNNDTVMWVEIDPSKLKVGDIIIYDYPTDSENKFIAHRIINITQEGEEYKFETKGDNRAKSDAETALSAYYVSEDDLKGLVIGVIYSKNLKSTGPANGWKKTEQMKATISAPALGWIIAETWTL